MPREEIAGEVFGAAPSGAPQPPELLGQAPGAFRSQVERVAQVGEADVFLGRGQGIAHPLPILGEIFRWRLPAQDVVEAPAWLGPPAAELIAQDARGPPCE